jgi:type IV secretory pathway VirD2 relaxase
MARWRPEALHNRLFGRQEDDEGEQSWLITFDSLSDSSPHIELRGWSGAQSKNTHSGGQEKI